MADRQSVLLPWAAKEIVHKRINPRKGRLDGGMQGMVGENLRANRDVDLL